MAITIQWTISPTACAGGHHFDFNTIVKNLGPDFSIPTQVPDLSQRPGDWQLETFAYVFDWMIAKRYLADATHAQIRTLLNNKQIVLTPGPIP